MVAKFGPAGNPDAFYDSGYKASVDMPEWLKAQNLTAYEYQCSRGANVSEQTARAIGGKACEHDIKLSIHAPYYISLATEDETIAANTKQHFVKSLQVARWMGADRIVFHIGGPGKQERRSAMERAKKLFDIILEEAELLGLNDIYVAPETMGKKNQLGNLQEVLELCQISKKVIPAIDFGHLHAVSGGSYNTREEYERVFDEINSCLGFDIVKNVHIHFSKIEFTKAGEKRHWTFADSFGPPFEPFIEACVNNKLTPRIICESAGTQALDARIMSEYYFKLLGVRA